MPVHIGKCLHVIVKYIRGILAVWHPHWFQLEWAEMLTNAHISVKELVPMILAIATWGRLWRNHSIQVLSDNTKAVAAINSNSSKVRESAHLLRSLAFLLARFQCQLSAKYLPGANNLISDALSRNLVVTTVVVIPTGRCFAYSTLARRRPTIDQGNTRLDISALEHYFHNRIAL